MLHAHLAQCGWKLTFAVVVCEGLVDEVGPLLKEGTQVEPLGVVGLDAVVRDARAGVEIHTGVDVHERGALRHVEDVRHPEFLQAHCILGYEPEKVKIRSRQQVADVCCIKTNKAWMND